MKAIYKRGYLCGLAGYSMSVCPYTGWRRWLYEAGHYNGKKQHLINWLTVRKDKIQ